MSFAINAAPFSENYSNINDNKSAIDKKRNRTIKKPIQNETPSHVSAMMQRIHNKPDDDDDDLQDFNQDNNTTSSVANNIGRSTTVAKDDPVSIEAFTKLPNDSSAAEYYKQYIPTHYNQISENTNGNHELLEKLNYMIHLLEEQQNEKTGHVTEEVILYSFLGVFIIFVVDSFARAGKYIR
jgi:hypothetical protein